MNFLRAIATITVVLLPLGVIAQQESQQQKQVQTKGRSVRATYPQNREGFGAIAFGDECRSCHGNPQAKPPAQAPAEIRKLSPERIYQSITTGSMKQYAGNLTEAEKRGVAEFISGRRLGSADHGGTNVMSNVCSTNPPVRAEGDLSSWNGWSPDLFNTRFLSSKAGAITAAQVQKLQLKWAFGVPGAMSMYAQVSIFDGRVFVGSDAGYVYSVDSATGCVHWAFQAQTGIRSAVTVGPVRAGSNRLAAFFGDVHANAYAIDAANGELLWKVLTDEEQTGRITGAPKLYQGRVYFPVTGLDEPESLSDNFPCCTDRGLVVALDAETGKQIWKTYVLDEPAQLIARNGRGGAEVWGPSGGGVWNSPTIDAKRRAIYFGTGNALTGPETEFTDGIMALDLDNGKKLWTFQGTTHDIWRVGPDVDFAASPILVTRPDGRTLLIAGQKSGSVFALDPDSKGALIWKYSGPQDRGRTSIVFGGTADDRNAYFNSRPGIFAVQLADGAEKWFTPFPSAPEAMSAHAGASAAMSAIPGVVFSVGLDGMARALDANTGKFLWEYNTAQEFKTVNGVPAKGGSMGSGGVAVGQRMIFLASGYIGYQNGAAGNVLLAFEPAQ